jgi:UDP:flavonoid glycosyltransferase YjiC (YdhE family)
LPPSIQVAAHLPFDALLPQVAVLVHHGGIGTTAAALAAGIPQLVIPFAFDQFDNAARVARLGVGRACPTLDAAAWTAALRTLLAPDDARRDALRRYRTLLAEAPDASVQIAEHLEHLLPVSPLLQV